jgi:hypothetical protein
VERFPQDYKLLTWKRAEFLQYKLLAAGKHVGTLSRQISSNETEVRTSEGAWKFVPTNLLEVEIIELDGEAGTVGYCRWEQPDNFLSFLFRNNPVNLELASDTYQYVYRGGWFRSCSEWQDKSRKALLRFSNRPYLLVSSGEIIALPGLFENDDWALLVAAGWFLAEKNAFAHT